MKEKAKTNSKELASVTTRLAETDGREKKNRGTGGEKGKGKERKERQW